MDHMSFQMPGMGRPPILNQPPQIFGGYGPDGLPNVPQMPPDLAAHMFSESHLLMDDSNEAKRRRIARVRPVPGTIWQGRVLMLAWSLGLRYVQEEEDQV
jgi:hypothetical protein